MEVLRMRGLIAAIGLALSVLPASAAAGGRQGGAPRLTNVVVTPDGAFVHVSLRASGPLPAVTPSRTTEGAPRLFVDLPGVLAGTIPPQIGGAGPVLRVRVAQYTIDPLVTRVVLDLRDDVTFGIARTDGASSDVTIAVAQTAASAAQPAAAAADPMASAAPARPAARTIPISQGPASPAAALAANRAAKAPSALVEAAATVPAPSATSAPVVSPVAAVSRAPAAPRVRGAAAAGVAPQPEPAFRPSTSATAPAVPHLTGVTVTPDGAFVQVHVTGSGPLPAVTPVRTDTQGACLIVDLPGVDVGALPAQLAGAGPIVAVRVAPHPTDAGITRIALDLSGDVSFGVARADDTSRDIMIAVAAVAAGVPEAATAVPAAPARPAPARPAPTAARTGSLADRPVAATSAPKAAATVVPTPTHLTALTLSPDGAFVQVELRASGALPRIAPVSTRDGRPRLVVDLPGVRPGAVPPRLPGAGPIVDVRLTPHPADPLATRVSFDLTGDVSFGVVRAGDTSTDVTIAVAPVAGASANDGPAVTAPVALAATATPAAATAPPPDPPPAAPSAASLAPSAAPGTAPIAPAPIAAPAPETSDTPAPAPQPAAAMAVASETIPMAAAMSATGAQGAPATMAMSTAAGGDGQTATAPMSTAQVPMPAPRPTSGFGMGRQAPRPTGRVSVYAGGASASQMGGDAMRYGDITTAVTYQFLDRDTDGVEFGLDMRHSAYTIEGRDPRVSVYNGFVGARLANGHATLRAGQLWLDDLGGLGAVAGGQVEARSGPIPSTGLGRWRGGLFAGLDPNIYKFGYGGGVRKTGGYVVLEGTRGRRHVTGYVNIKNGDITERSVLSFANFVPAGPLFVYQVAEYDLSPIAGGLGHDGLTYFFSNARLMVGPRAELQGTVSRGRSVDARGLSDDIQAGRPVTQQAVDGLLYESVGGRVTGEVLPGVRVYGGYSRDKNNRDDAPTNRWLTGGYASNVFDSGVDLTVSDSRMMRPTGSYHSTFVSAGREFLGRLYATAEFSTALSQIQFVRGDGIVVESRPSTKRFGMNATMQVGRQMSSFLSVERTMDGPDYREWRVLAGLTYRLR
ncbi:MAG: hypothetical protein R2712_26105 [Vicinamibacterales bacterium]